MEAANGLAMHRAFSIGTDSAPHIINAYRMVSRHVDMLRACLVPLCMPVGEFVCNLCAVLKVRIAFGYMLE